MKLKRVALHQHDDLHACSDVAGFETQWCNKIAMALTLTAAASLTMVLTEAPPTKQPCSHINIYNL